MKLSDKRQIPTREGVSGTVLPTLAVIPFEFTGGQGEPLDAIGEILANNVINLLSGSLHINVISRLSTTRFRGKLWSCSDVSDKLNCDFVLHGSYAENNNALSIEFHLTDIGADSNIWFDRIQCNVYDIVDARSGLVADLAKNAEHRIFKSTVTLADVESLDSLETHSLYISGINLMHAETEDQFMLSKDCLTQIASRQPHHSTVNALLSLWHLLKVQRTGGWTLRDQQQTSAVIRHFVDKSLSLHPGNEFAMALKGTVEVQFFKNLEQGLVLVRNALATQRKDPIIFTFCALVFLSGRLYNDAAKCVEKAILLSPLDPQLEFFYAVAAATYYHTGQLEQAETYAEKSLLLNPMHTSPLRTIIATQMARNEPELARENAHRLMQVDPKFTVNSWLEHWSGDSEDGKNFAQHLMSAGIPRGQESARQNAP